MSYLLDADVFIRAKNLHYGLDFCPAFWSWLIERKQDGAAFERGEARRRDPGWCRRPGRVGQGHTVVTHEVPSPTVRRIKIPDACVGLRIKCMTPYEMLRRERARFVLGPTP